MKKTLQRELFGNMLVMIILIIVIVIVGLINIKQQKNNFDKLIIEYREMSSIHDLNYSLNEFSNSFGLLLMLKTDSAENVFLQNLKKVYNNYNLSKNTVSKSHSIKLLNTIGNNLIIVITEGKNVIKNKNNLSEYLITRSSSIINNFNELAVNSENEIIVFQNEEKKEINEYIVNYNKINNQSIYTLFFIGLIIIIGSAFWGLNFVKKRTTPIYKLIDFTKTVSEGNLTIKNEVKFGNELDFLSKSINTMVENLNNITISRNYFDNIIGSIKDLIIITDSNGIIEMTNDAIYKMLGYYDNELVGKKINCLFSENNADIDFLLKNESFKNQNIEIILLTKSKNEVSALISLSKMINKQTGTISLIYVIHDITENKRIQNQLEKERKERAVAIIDAQENERMRIATDLHDGLGQTLTSILYYIENNFSEISTNNKENIVEINNRLNTAIKETKSIAYNIIPMLLKDFGLIVAVKKLANSLLINNKINIIVTEFNFKNRLESKLEKILYRICQEALNNIVKHSQAKNVNIQFIKHDNSVVLLIDDDGIGFDSSKINLENGFSGIGLISMKERVATFNGTFSITSEKEKGTEILIELPC